MSTDEIINLRIKLQAVSKRKYINEIEMISVRTKVLLQTEELDKAKEEVELLKIKIDIQNKQIQEGLKQLSVINMCKACDYSKIHSQLNDIKIYKKAYEDLFLKEKQVIDNQYREQKQKQDAQKQEKKQTQMMLEQQRNVSLKEVLSLEEEANALTRECAVLKKRNAAIMLKLQRTLIEKEDARRSNEDNMLH